MGRKEFINNNVLVYMMRVKKYILLFLLLSFLKKLPLDIYFCPKDGYTLT